jgi:acetyltransferase-like isoleucine patch superfamily enzyme
MSDASEPGRWMSGTLPPNARIGNGTLILGSHAFHRFLTKEDAGLEIGAGCTMDGVHFAISGGGRVKIGDHCYFTNALLLCELEITIGSYVVMGWNATIADSDFHPIAPAERVADAVACSPLAQGRARPPILRERVIIEDDVWIGPNATILKGVRVGCGSFVEAGALVTRDVPPGVRIAGNPARVLGGV